jgi:hypothetical protein
MQTVCGKTWLGGKTGRNELAWALPQVGYTRGYQRREDKGGKSCVTATNYLIKVVRPGALELPTFWFVAVEAGNLSALRGVAYGRFCSFSYSSIVRRLYANFPMRSTLIFPISLQSKLHSLGLVDTAVSED